MLPLSDLAGLGWLIAVLSEMPLSCPAEPGWSVAAHLLVLLPSCLTGLLRSVAAQLVLPLVLLLSCLAGVGRSVAEPLVPLLSWSAGVGRSTAEQLVMRLWGACLLQALQGLAAYLLQRLAACLMCPCRGWGDQMLQERQRRWC